MRETMVIVTLVTALAAAGQARAGAGDDALSRRVGVIDAYRTAKQAHDAEGIAACLSADARIWFEKKHGAGKPIHRGTGGGPWSEWDRFFRARSRRVGDDESGDGWVRTLVEETNDYYRLLDRPPKRYHATYYFDAADRIEGILIASVPASEREKAEGRFDEFEVWVRAMHPGALEDLMPGGDIDPKLENAKRWRKLLVEWRREQGLGPIDLGPE